MKKQIAYNGSGLRWHPTLDSIMGAQNKPGVFFDLKLTEVRLYAFINWECGKARERAIELSNQQVMAFTKLDKDTLPKTRKALVKRKLITATKIGRGENYAYEILDPQSGWSLSSNRYSPKSSSANGQESADDDEDDNWGMRA
jgi:hypothetical protein